MRGLRPSRRFCTPSFFGPETQNGGLVACFIFKLPAIYPSRKDIGVTGLTFPNRLEGGGVHSMSDQGNYMKIQMNSVLSSDLTLFLAIITELNLTWGEGGCAIAQPNIGRPGSSQRHINYAPE